MFCGVFSTRLLECGFLMPIRWGVVSKGRLILRVDAVFYGSAGSSRCGPTFCVWFLSGDIVSLLSPPC